MTNEEIIKEYDEARTMALAVVMACKLTYGLLTKIQSFEEMAWKD